MRPLWIGLAAVVVAAGGCGASTSTGTRLASSGQTASSPHHSVSLLSAGNFPAGWSLAPGQPTTFPGATVVGNTGYSYGAGALDVQETLLQFPSASAADAQVGNVGKATFGNSVNIQPMTLPGIPADDYAATTAQVGADGTFYFVGVADGNTLAAFDVQNGAPSFLVSVIKAVTD